MIAIVDYGVGNLFSLQSSLAALGLNSAVVSEPGRLQQAERVILPGVGAFGDAMQKLHAAGLDTLLIKMAGQGVPLLGVCLGMQLLFEASNEFGSHRGLGLVPGKITSLEAALRRAGYTYKVPHMGWNALTVVKPSPILKYTKAGEAFYYVHSYYAVDCAASLVAASEYGVWVPGVVQNANIYGTQFHPEKSGDCGLKILRAFSEAPRC